MSADRSTQPAPAEVPKATPEQLSRLAALLRPHIPAILAARAARKAAS